jgi:hypothetical protein
MSIAFSDAASVARAGSNTLISVKPATVVASTNTCLLSAAFCGCVLVDEEPPPPHATTSMDSRQRNVGRTPKVIFLLDRIRDLSLFYSEHKQRSTKSTASLSLLSSYGDKSFDNADVC